MEAGGRRRKGQRILYFFRTPPAVRVGREAIDADAMRLLEHHNPDVRFDWPRLLRSGAAASASVPTTSGSRDDRRRQRRDQRPQRPVPETSHHSVERSAPVADSEDPSTPPEPPRDLVPGQADLMDPAEFTEPVALVEPEPEEPGELEEPREPGRPGESVEPREPLPDRYARLGADGLARLRARYVELKRRLDGQTLEDAERAELTGRLERLNPDAWQTEEEVGRAFEEYESVFESVRPSLGRPGRPRRL